MSHNSSSEQINEFKIEPWSNKFEVSHNLIVDDELNSELLKVINTKTLKYGTKVQKFGTKLRSKKYCKYQSQLLTSYLKHPQDNLKLDCDRLVITIHCEESDINKLSKKAKVQKPSVKATGEFLTIKQCGVGRVNGGKKGPSRPYYTTCYKHTLYGDPRRFFNLYVADGTHHKHKLTALRIDFIPNRFNDLEIQILFGHLRYLLTNRRYEQLTKHANVSRVDIGFNMPGMLSSFVYLKHMNNHRPKIECLPNEIKNSLIETTYRGNRFKSSHYILYEKLLKEFYTEVKAKRADEKSLDELLPRLAVTTRVEQRYFSNRSTKVSLAELPEVNIGLPLLKFVNPKYLYTLSPKQLTSLVRNKCPSNVQEVIRDQRKQNPRKTRLTRLSLDGQWFDSEKQRLLLHYQQLILAPELILAAQLKSIARAYKAIKPDAPAIKKVIKATKAKFDGELSPEQKEAVRSDAKHTLVQAGAGTGKTRTIIERVKYMIGERKEKPSDIAVLTYTKAATKEIKQRIEADVKGASQLNIRTFNSWCLDLLKSLLPETYGNYNQMTKESCTTVIGESLNKHGITDKGAFDLILKTMSYRVNAVVKLERAYGQLCGAAKFTYEQFHDVWKDYKKYKRDNSLLDFDDQFELFYRMLGKNLTFLEQVVNNNKHLIMDEMQDSNIIQWRILQRLTKNGCSLYCVGDPTQGVYGFRGADANYLDDFEQKFKSSVVKYLVDNYRSSPELLALTNVVRKEVNPAYKNLIGKTDSSLVPRYGEFLDLEGASKYISRIIKEKLDEGIKLKDIKVLVRTNSYVTKLAALIDASYSSMVQDDKDDEHYKLGVFDSLVMTMHSAKGTECEVGFVVDRRFTSALKAFQDSKDDHLRLHYVALTRAKRELHICKSMVGNAEFSDEREGDTHILDLICSDETLVEFNSK